MSALPLHLVWRRQAARRADDGILQALYRYDLVDFAGRVEADRKADPKVGPEIQDDSAWEEDVVRRSAAEQQLFTDCSVLPWFAEKRLWGEDAVDDGAGRAILLEKAAAKEVELLRREAALGVLREALLQRGIGPISEARRHALDAGVEEDADLMRKAASVLQELSCGACEEDLELEKARDIVHKMSANIKDLRMREQSLSGAVHKKERNAIGKEIMAINNNSVFVWAQHLVKNSHLPDSKVRRMQMTAAIPTPLRRRC